MRRIKDKIIYAIRSGLRFCRVAGRVSSAVKFFMIYDIGKFSEFFCIIKTLREDCSAAEEENRDPRLWASVFLCY